MNKGPLCCFVVQLGSLDHFLPLFIHSPNVDSATCSSLETASALLRAAGHMSQELNGNVLRQEAVPPRGLAASFGSSPLLPG